MGARASISTIVDFQDCDEYDTKEKSDNNSLQSKSDTLSKISTDQCESGENTSHDEKERRQSSNNEDLRDDKSDTKDNCITNELKNPTDPITGEEKAETNSDKIKNLNSRTDKQVKPRRNRKKKHKKNNNRTQYSNKSQDLLKKVRSKKIYIENQNVPNQGVMDLNVKNSKSTIGSGKVKFQKKQYPIQNQKEDFLNQLNSEIDEEVRISTDYINGLTSCCKKIKEAIQNTAQEFFKEESNSAIQVAAYGSMETSLALPGSDLDLAICGVKIANKDELVNKVEKFAEKVSQLSFITQIKAITSARIPVIKITADLKRIDPVVTYKMLSVDITIDDPINSPCNYAICSAELIKCRCKLLPFFRPITLVLKKLLRSAELNNPYHGGLGSYTLSLMASAFLRMCPPLETAGETLIECLRYYGNEFNQSKMAVVHGEYIMILPEPNTLPFHTRNTIGRNLIVWDPFQPMMNVAINVTQFSQIQNCFSNMYTKLATQINQSGMNQKNFLEELYDNCRETAYQSSLTF